MPDDKQTHVVFGAGQIGPLVAQQLLKQGHQVRMVRRSAGAPPAGVSLRTGDAADPAFVAEATQGASVLYHCMNPVYSAAEWQRTLPRWRQALLAAAARNRTRIVLLDNLYALGLPRGMMLSESSPIDPSSKKGAIRAHEWRSWLEAHQKGDAMITCGRASDFYGPGATQTYFGDSFMPKAIGSGVAQTLTRLDTPHTYHYLHDVAAGLATLGGAPDDAYGRWWMLPAAPAESTRAMIARLGSALGQELKIQAMPRFMVSALALFVPVLRELSEMSYQWESAFVADDRAFRQRFGADATPLDVGARAMAEWARMHYAASLGV